MVNFFELPRELRDMIYVEVVLWQRPVPTLGEAQWLFRFRRISDAQSRRTGEYGCAYSLDGAPSTCANFLCVNRQVHEEMGEVLKRVKRRGEGVVRLDCIAEDESFHYFTWVGCSVVETTYKNEAIRDEGSHVMGLVGLVGRFMRWCVLGGAVTRHIKSTTRIHKLCIDVRIAGDRSAKWLRNSTDADRTSWAICAALKRLLTSGPDLSSPPPSPTTTATVIDELTLNVIPPPSVPPSDYLPEDTPSDERAVGIVHPRSVARELLDVWTKLWTWEGKTREYGLLLEKVGCVRVCVDGRVWGRREVGRELMRGRQVMGRRLG